MKANAKCKRASGGVVPKDPAPKDVYAGASSNVVEEAKKKKDGGRVKKEVGAMDGKKSKMRLDRPGRKMGGRVGADSSPLSSAAKTSGPSDKGDD